MIKHLSLPSFKQFRKRLGASLRYLTRVLILILSLTLLAGLSAQAQSGGDYDLRWFTVDGGGYTWSEGGAYRLGGTIGQADAGAAQTGGSYTLQGGFWRRHCTPKVVDVSISCQGDRVELDWTTDPANKAYAIYRATDPYQTPVPTDPIAQITSPPWQDAPGTCGDPDVNYYYLVRSVCVGAHADADEQGEFDFPLVPGQP